MMQTLIGADGLVLSIKGSFEISACHTTNSERSRTTLIQTDGTMTVSLDGWRILDVQVIENCEYVGFQPQGVVTVQPVEIPRYTDCPNCGTADHGADLLVDRWINEFEWRATENSAHPKLPMLRKMISQELRRMEELMGTTEGPRHEDRL